MLNLARFEYSRMQIQTPKVVGAKSRNFLFATLPKRSSAIQNLRLGSIKLLQKIIASQKNQHIASQLLPSFVIILQSCYKRWQHTRKTNTSHRATIFCNHLAKLLQKMVASQKNQHIASNYYLCNHLAKLLQKMVASQKNQHIASNYYLL